MNAFAKWAAAVAALPVLAQTAQNAEFQTGVTNIQVDVQAVYQGKNIPSLGKGDFIVRDEGAIRPILSFDEDSDPLDLIFLLDTGWADRDNSDTNKNTRQVAAIAASALQRMRPLDRTAVISFAVDPRVEQELTTDPKSVVEAFQRIPRNTVNTSQRMLALRWAGYLLAADRPTAFGFGPDVVARRRKRAVLIVTSDHYDFLSQGPDEPIIEQYWGLDASLNAIVFHGVEAGVEWIPRMGDMAHIAHATGGEAIIGTGKEAPEKAIPDLLARIQSSYTLFYAPPAAKSGEVRHITVELSDEAKKKYPGAVIHAREGYIAK